MKWGAVLALLCCAALQAAADPPRPDIRRVHVVAMNHLDVGFSCPGCGPRQARDPYTWTLLNLYLNQYLPGAANTSAATNGSYVYTTHCWLISFFFDCPRRRPAFPIECPSSQAVSSVTAAIRRGWLSWHAFPFNGEPEALDARLFGDGLGLCHALDDRFRQPRSAVLSQRDVPGLTRAVIPLLVERGVRAVSVGANTFSASADVPAIYRWRDPVSNASLVALQHPGGYGDGATVIAPGSEHALHLMFNGDNAGGHTPTQVRSRHAMLGTQFPNAQIVGATWTNYISAIEADGSSARLPKVSKEEGDTWIYGVQQDAYKTAALRAIMRARRACIARLGEQLCGGNASTALRNSTRFALKLAEHTWGFGWAYMDEIHYTNDDLAYALEHVNGFSQVVDGWIEQRAYVNHTVDALAAADSEDAGAAALLGMIQDELAELRPSEPILEGWTEIEPTRPVTDLPQFRAVAWNASAGGISALVSRTGHDFVHGRSFAQYQYQTLDETDFWVFMNETLKVQRDVAFGKRNLTANANVTSGFWVGKLQTAYRKSSSEVDSFLQQIQLDSHLHRYYGAPTHVWTLFEFSRSSPLVNVSVMVFNKARTRLPEAHWVDFEVLVPTVAAQSDNPAALKCDSWTVAKLGSTFCATDVSLFGSTHIHAVSDADTTQGSLAISSESTEFRLTTRDAALVSLEYKTAFPNPVHKTLDTGVKASSAYCNLYNNFWTTNYPNWQPFATNEENLRFRFELRFGG